MKVLILAGGFGTRLAEYTDVIPKPMVQVGGKPIIWHIMQHFASYGHKDFVVALGYKSEVIKQYFLGISSTGSNFTVETGNGNVQVHDSSAPDWKVTLIDTGLDSLTGERVARVREHLGEDSFFLTYGDGVSNVDLGELLQFHRSHGKTLTMTAVRPPARFGELRIADTGLVESFQEKPQLHSGWINGGFFVVEPKFLDLIPRTNVMLEREPLEAATRLGQLMAFQHEGFWQCMDTKRDVELLQSLWDTGSPPWLQIR